ncbi:MAG: hypothetical protein IRZ21_05070 [Thermoleophilaceae bacterium]|nr:hypothetical protein [Thermoleophilaceae bacterium]
MTRTAQLWRRLAVAAPAVAIAVVAVALLTGGGGGSPPDGAARRVPGNALLYLHLAADRSSEAWARAAGLARRLPLLAQARDRLLALALAPAAGLRLDRAAGSWLGGEAAYAELPGGGGEHVLPLLVAEARYEGGARKALARFPRRGGYRGTRFYDLGRSRAALDSGWLLVGPERALRAALDTGAGRVPALADERAYARLTAALPRERIAHAWLGAGAIRRYAARPVALLADAAGAGPVRAAALAFTPGAGRFQLDVRALASGSGGCPPEGDAGALARRAPAAAAAFVAVSRLDCVLARALPAATGGGLGGALAGLATLARGGGADLVRESLPLLSRPAALALTPGAGQPRLTLALGGVPKGKGIELVGRLQPALARLVGAAGEGEAPGYSTRRVAGVTAFTSRLNSALTLDYAEIGGDLVVANGPGAIAAAATGRSLEDDGDYRQLLGDRPDGPASVVFLDFDRLLALADRAGLARNPAYAAVRGDIHEIGAAGAYVARDGEQLNAELLFRNP